MLQLYAVRITESAIDSLRHACYMKSQVDWGFSVGAMASVSFIGAFRFLAMEKFSDRNS